MVRGLRREGRRQELRQTRGARPHLVTRFSPWSAAALGGALFLLAKNAIPALGILVREWAAPGALLLYLGENIAMIALAAIAVRVRAPESEVIEGKSKTRRESLQTFLLVAVPFTFGAAVFTVFVIAVRDEYTFDTRELLTGLAIMLAFQLLAFATDLHRLRGITLADSEHLLVGVLGRVFLLALAVWLGLVLAFFVSSAFVIPFIVLKTIVDLGSLRDTSVRLKQRLRV